MKKLLFFMLLPLVIYAKPVDALAVIVNDEPITVYEIHKAQTRFKVNKDEAVNILIKVKLEDFEIKNRKINTSNYKIEERFKKIAAGNNMSSSNFENALRAKRVNVIKFKDEIKGQLDREMLYEQIVRSEIKKPTDEELKSYYDRNSHLFNIPKEVGITKYTSFSAKALNALQQNPLMQNPDIKSEDAKIETKRVPRQLLEVLLKTKEGNFTPILPVAKGVFITIFIKKKLGMMNFDFESNKNKIVTVMYKNREQDILKGYFNKVRTDSIIKVLR